MIHEWSHAGENFLCGWQNPKCMSEPGSGTQKSSSNCQNHAHLKSPWSWGVPPLVEADSRVSMLATEVFYTRTCGILQRCACGHTKFDFSSGFLIMHLCPLGTNARYFHCFCDEDSMGWAKKVCRKMSRRHMELGICKAANLRLLSLRWRSFVLNRQSMARRWKKENLGVI